MEALDPRLMVGWATEADMLNGAALENPWEPMDIVGVITWPDNSLHA